MVKTSSLQDNIKKGKLDTIEESSSIIPNF